MCELLYLSLSLSLDLSIYLSPPSPPLSLSLSLSECQVWAVFPEMCWTDRGGRCFPVLPEEMKTHVENG